MNRDDLPQTAIDNTTANIRTQIAYLENIISTPALRDDLTEFGVQTLADRITELETFLADKLGVRS